MSLPSMALPPIPTLPTPPAARTVLAALVAFVLSAVPVAVAAQRSPAAPGDERPAGEITTDVVYGHKAGMALTFDVIRPAGPANGAGILYMVSGGWFSRWSPAEETADRMDAVLDEGFTVFTVRHGSAPVFTVPEAHADVDRALRHIKRNAGEWGVDPERLGVFGGSAGGHLSLMLGMAPDHGGVPDGEAGGEGESGDGNGEEHRPSITAAEGDDEVAAADDRVAAVVAYYPPVDVRSWAGPSERFPALDFDPGLGAHISPILYVTPDDPPTLLIHGDADGLVPYDHSVRMFDALQEAGVTSDFVTIEGGDHGFRNPEHRARAEAAMVAWFVEHLE